MPQRAQEFHLPKFPPSLTATSTQAQRNENFRHIGLSTSEVHHVSVTQCCI